MLKNVNINRYFLFAATSVSILAASVIIEPPAVTSSPVRVSQNNDNFRSGIRVCNNAAGSGTIYMAVAIQRNFRTRTVGWYSADEGDCVTIINRIEEGKNYYLYAHASADNRLYWEGRSRFCVRHPQRFDISNAENTRNCSATRNFYMLSTAYPRRHSSQRRRYRSQLTEYLNGFGDD